MSATPKKFYLTTPIYYVNARPHIGHAYTTIVADVLARRHRLLGEDTFFLTGTDEHGQKIERSAAAAGIPPQQFADQVSESFETLWRRMGITNDRYIRTTDPKHKRGAKKLFADLYARGFIYLSTYTGQYSIGEEMFVDGPPGTLGPDGKPTETVTEENFFFRLSAFQRPLLDLIESNTLKVENEARRNEVLSFLRGNVHAATQSNLASALVNEEHDALLSAENDLMSPGAAPIATETFEWAGDASPRPRISHSTLGIPYVEGALKDLSVSRSSFTWGIPVPEPAASEAAQKHVIYVWLDALANYMTAIGYGSDDPTDQAEFAEYWPVDLHLVGKEIIRFHCVYWPAFLLALNPELQQPTPSKTRGAAKGLRISPDPATLPKAAHQAWAAKMLPKAITAHGWLLFDNSKMSKSKGNIVRTETILDAFGTLCPPRFTGLEEGFSPPLGTPAEGALAPGLIPPTKADRDLFASDVLRYFLLREIPFGQDGSFSFDALITRYNADLANGYGNLVSRTFSMILKFLDGAFPMGLPSVDSKFQNFFANYNANYQFTSEKFNFSKSLEDISFAIARADQALSAAAPWKLVKQTDEVSKQQLKDVLRSALETIQTVTIQLYPFIPTTARRVYEYFGVGPIENANSVNEWPDQLALPTDLDTIPPIFPRAPKELADIMLEMENPNPEVSITTPETIPEAPLAATPAPAEPTPAITIDDFAKIELRVAQILVAERIPKADKLLRLEVDLGYERRQILSGIAEFYSPEDLIGRRIVVITNLAPRKMRGLESHGMLLAASADPGPDGKPTKPVLATMAEDIPLGSRLK